MDDKYIVIVLVIGIIGFVTIFNILNRIQEKRLQQEHEEKVKEQERQEAERIKNETYRLGDFSLRITPCVRKESGYVLMLHGTKYKIVISNYSELRANAILFIDGKHIGTYRLNSKQNWAIERPPNDTACFTFYEYGTSEGFYSGLKKNDSLGLVQCLFIPEKPRPEPDIRWSIRDEPQVRFSATSKVSAGGTGLSGRSDQEFRYAEKIELDEENSVEISLRLVCFKERPHSLRSSVPPPIK